LLACLINAGVRATGSPLLPRKALFLQPESFRFLALVWLAALPSAECDSNSNLTKEKVFDCNLTSPPLSSGQ